MQEPISALVMPRTTSQLYRSTGLLPPQDGTVSTHGPRGIHRLAARLGDVPIGVFTADWTLVPTESAQAGAVKLAALMREPAVLVVAVGAVGEERQRHRERDPLAVGREVVLAARACAVGQAGQITGVAPKWVIKCPK
jgi:hypothetical protein